MLTSILERRTLMREWLELGESNTKPLRVGCYHAVARAIEAAAVLEGAISAGSRGATAAADGAAPRESEGEGDASRGSAGGGGSGGAAGGSSASDGRAGSGAGAGAGLVPAAQRVFDGLGAACGDVTMAVLMRALRQVRTRALTSP